TLSLLVSAGCAHRTTIVTGGRVDVDIDWFVQVLAPYGTWTVDATYGRVFVPYDEGYEPYRDGRWTWRDDDWYWESAEPFGEVVCHYGRWLYRDRWVWVPDTRWGPGWVSWRHAPGVIGWAP